MNSSTISPAARRLGRPPVPGRRLGLRPFGIEITADPSWLILVVLLVLSLSANLGALHPELAPAVRWTGALAGSALFFASLLLHEMAHSLVARAKGIEVRGITLFALGGVSQMGSESENPRDEFQIAAVGPAMSLGLGLLFASIGLALPEGTVVQTLASWLGTSNLILAAFNLIPGFPLDGGRILKAAVWRFTGSRTRSTRLAARAGGLVAYVFMAGGAVLALGLGLLIPGVWIAFIGWFLFSASRASLAELESGEILKRVRVEQAMQPDCPTVGPNVSVRELVDDHMLQDGARCYAVPDGDGFRGLVTMKEVRSVPAEERSRTSVEQIMVPAWEVPSAAPDETLAEALGKMNAASVQQLPVLEGHVLRGLLTREDILGRIALHLELEGRRP
jgi:Zn-dependent protease/CBS domain-containing protein